MNILLDAIEKKVWRQIWAQFTPEHAVRALSFRRAMGLAHSMLLNDERDDEIREYAVRLLQQIRDSYQEEWDADWRNDKFLGDACYLIVDYEGKYASYMRAYEKVEHAPASLLLALAGCDISPDVPSVTLQEAEDLVKRALQEGVSPKAAILMKGICSQKNDAEGVKYWDKILQDIGEKSVPVKNDWPEFT